jgi:hypothetical protein
MNTEKYLEDECLDLIVRKHVYNCSRIFKAADHILYNVHVGVRTCKLYIVQYIWERVQDGKKQEWQKCPAGTRQTDGKNRVWFGEIERKLAKLSKTILSLTVLPLNYFMTHSF